MTHDAETVERVAKALSHSAGLELEYLLPQTQGKYRRLARAALSALPPQEVSDYQQGFQDGCNHMKEDYEAGKKLDAKSKEVSVQEAMQALRAFSDCADMLDDETKNTGREYPDGEWAKFRLLVSDYRKARAALRALSEGKT